MNSQLAEPNTELFRICGFVILAFFGLTQSGKAQTTGPIQKRLKWKVEAEIEHDYLIFFPNGYEHGGDKKWPLIVYLHGGGGNAALLKRQLGPLRDKPFIILAPICPELPEGVPGHYKNWKPEPLGAIVRKVKVDYPVDELRCSLMGFSMGGSGAWALPFYHPDLFSRVVVMSGSCHPWKLKHFPMIPVRAYSGSKESWLPQHTATVSAAKQFGLKVEHTIWPGAGHGACRQRTLADESLWEWLAETEP